jgi:hypothetical protein
MERKLMMEQLHGLKPGFAPLLKR